MTTLIKVSNLSKSFKDKVALDQVNFSVQAGQIFGFLGSSGAGKTTTINILTNQLKADSSQANILNKPSNNIHSTDLKLIGIMSDSVGFYEKMTVYKNLEFFARYHHVPLTEVDNLLKRLDLYEDRKKKAEKISTGMKQRLMLIRAVLHQPQVLFLDEPTSGMDPTLAKKVHELLLELRASGTAIFLTTHNMEEATKICDHIALLNHGKILEYGSPQSIIDKYNAETTVEIQYLDGRRLSVEKDQLQNYLTADIKSINSFEPTLENIFIHLTGENYHE